MKFEENALRNSFCLILAMSQDGLNFVTQKMQAQCYHFKSEYAYMIVTIQFETEKMNMNTM